MGQAVDIFGSQGNGGAAGTGYAFLADDYDDLVAIAPGPHDVGTLARCFNSQGTAWLPAGMGGNYYPSGAYIWNGSAWVSDRNNIAKQLQDLIDDILGLQLIIADHVTDTDNPHFTDVTNLDDTLIISKQVKDQLYWDGTHWINYTKSYCHMYFASINGIPTPIPGALVPTKVVGATTQGFQTGDLQMTASNRVENTGSDVIRVKISLTMNVDKVGAGSRDITGYIAATGAVLFGSKMTTRNNGTLDNEVITCFFIQDLAAGQYVEAWVENINDGQDIICEDLSMMVEEL